MKIILFRHPKTDWNQEKRIQGSQEGVVLADSIKEMELLVSEFVEPSVSRILHADNQRTASLAKLFTKKYNLDSTLDTRLNERGFGDLEGLLKHEIDDPSYDPENYPQRLMWRPPQGETLLEVATRANQLIEELKTSLKKDKTAICVTSGLTIKMILWVQRNISLSEALNTGVPPLARFDLEVKTTS